MENAPIILLFWYFIIAIFILMIALMIIAIVLSEKKAKDQSNNNWKLMGKICLGMGIVCAIPIITVLGYILYLHIG